MKLFNETNINFIGNKNKAFVFSVILIVVSIVSLFIPRGKGDTIGPNMSIDFVGGTLVRLKFNVDIRDRLGDVRNVISALELGNPEIKTIGRAEDNEVQITVKKKSEDDRVAATISSALEEAFGADAFTVEKKEMVGPKIGGELGQKAVWSVILSLIAIVIYIGFRFKLPFGIASIVALFHDVIIVIGVFSVFNVEFSLPMIAALLTIVGYSLNDTIVVFDRIRENLGGTVVKKSFEDRVNTSINQCLSRTIITSLTTFLVVVTIFVAFLNSGDVLRDFALALLVGVVVGTYSSMFIASPVLIMWNKKWPIK